MLKSSCGYSGCHDGTSNSIEGFNATSYESILQSVKPGNPRGSKLYQSISDIHGENMMPPGSSLTQEQRMLIEVWIVQGAPEKNCSSGSSSSSSSSSGGPGSNDTICFKQTIQPLIVNNCSMRACHDGLSSGGEDGIFALTDYATIMAGGIIAGHPEASSLYQSTLRTGEDAMPPPPHAPLSSSQTELLRKWIADGALNSDCISSSCDTTGTMTYTQNIKSIIDNNCVGCHNTVTIDGGVNLSDYANVKHFGTTTRVGTSVPILKGVIRQMSGFIAMPPGSMLDECTIRKIELWISQGTIQ